MRKLLALCLALVLALGVLSGFASAEEKVHLVFVERYGSTTRTAALRALLDEFEAANPDIEIELISPPLESSQQKITQMLMAQNDLDLMELTAWERAQYIENGWLYNLKDYYQDFPDKETFTETVSSSLYTKDGDVYTVPLGCYERMIYYRADWMEELGLSFPEPGEEWTFDALYDIAKAMTDPEKGRYGWALRGGGNSHQRVPHRGRQEGHRIPAQVLQGLRPRRLRGLAVLRPGERLRQRHLRPAHAGLRLHRLLRVRDGRGHLGHLSHAHRRREQGSCRGPRL